MLKKIFLLSFFTITNISSIDFLLGSPNDTLVRQNRAILRAVNPEVASQLEILDKQETISLGHFKSSICAIASCIAAIYYIHLEPNEKKESHSGLFALGMLFVSQFISFKMNQLEKEVETKLRKHKRRYRKTV